MENFVNSLGKWLEFDVQMRANAEHLTVGIGLEKNSISLPYIYFKFNTLVLSCFPIDVSMKTMHDNFNVTIYFPSYKRKSIEIFSTLLSHLSILHYQISLCSRISCLRGDPFQAQNASFLDLYGKQAKDTPKPENVLPIFPLEVYPPSRVTWLRRTDYQNKPYYTTKDNINVLCYTWNVAQHPPLADTFHLTEWIFDQDADIIFITLQEIDFSASAVIFGGSERLEQWSDVFDTASKEKQYELVYGESLGGVMFYLMKKSTTTHKVELISHNMIRLGVGGLAANKSAILATIQVDLSKFVFIGAHLTPHNEHYVERNQQMLLILDSLKKQTDIDYTFLVGDFNYRIDLTYEETVDKINANQIDELYENDQLKRFQQENEQIAEYFEAKITFPPTYKFDPDSEIYDTSKKHRIPSWTDRCLVRTSKPNRTCGLINNLVFETDIIRHINYQHDFQGDSYFSTNDPPINYPCPAECVEYRNHDIKFSDHRPVSAFYNIPLEKFDQERYNEFETIRNHRLDQLVDLSIPRCHIEPTSFEVNKEIDLEFTNKSCAIAKWELGFIPPKTSIEPKKGVIYPGKTQILHLTTTTDSQEIQIAMINVEGGSPSAIEFWIPK